MTCQREASPQKLASMLPCPVHQVGAFKLPLGWLSEFGIEPDLVAAPWKVTANLNVVAGGNPNCVLAEVDVHRGTKDSVRPRFACDRLSKDWRLELPVDIVKDDEWLIGHQGRCEAFTKLLVVAVGSRTQGCRATGGDD